MTIFEKLQKKLAEHAAMYGDLPDFILLTDEEYGELVGISDKNYQPKANDRNFWGVPTSVSDAIEEFTFAYLTKPVKQSTEKWLIGENDDGLFIKIRDFDKQFPQCNPSIICNGKRISLDANEIIAPKLAELAIKASKELEKSENKPLLPPIKGK